MKVFSKKEIKSIEKFYVYINRKKIVTFVPDTHIEKVTIEMSKAGAGRIGEYEMCSFRTEGIGTFKPGKNAKPFSGAKNKLSFEKEVKLEMECGSENINNVVDALLNHHPYEETAYEIYDFRKREKKSSGVIINLKQYLSFEELTRKINKSIKTSGTYLNETTKRVAITNKEVSANLTESARFTGCGFIISESEKQFNLIKI